MLSCGADEGRQAVAASKKNLIFDTALSDGQWASDTLIKELQAQGYEIEVRVLATHKLESEHGVDGPDNGKIRIRVVEAQLGGRAGSTPDRFLPSIAWDSPDRWELCE